MLCTTALMLAARLAASDPDRLLAAVPADALAVVALAGLDEIRRLASVNAWWKLAQAPELQPLFARTDELMNQALDEALEESGDLDDEGLRKLADPGAWLRAVRGPALGYLVLNGDEIGGFGVFVDPGPEPAAFDELWDVVIERSHEDMTESTQEYQGVELLLLQSEGEPLGIFFEVAGLRALVAGSERGFVLELAQGGIDRLLGRDPSPGFAASAGLAEARRGAPATRAFEGFVDVGAFVRFGLAQDAREREADPDAAALAEDAALTQKMLERFGISAIRYAYLAGALGEDEHFDLSMSLHLPAGSLLQRASALLRPPSRELLALAPADALGITLGALDLAGLWQLVRGTTEELKPDALAQIDAGVAGFEGMTGVRLEQDLLQQIRGDFASVNVSIPAVEIPALVTGELGEEAAELMDAGAATVLAIEDGSTMEDVIARLLRSSGMAGMVQEEEYQGHTVSSFGAEGVGLHWACTDEYIVFAQTPTPMRAVLARVGGEDLPSLGADPRYQRILDEHPRAAVLTLSDARSAAETLLQLGEFVAAQMASSLLGEDMGSDLEQLLALFPDPAFVAEHIDGVLFQAVEVLPEGLSMRFGGR